MSLREELTCRTCSNMTYYDEATGYATDCPDCVDGIPRWAIELGVASNVEVNEIIVRDVLVALRDREADE